MALVGWGRPPAMILCHAQGRHRWGLGSWVLTWVLLPLYTTFEAEWFGPWDSIRHDYASQDQDNTLDKWVTGLVGAGEERYVLTIVHFGAWMMLTDVLWQAVCIPCWMLANWLIRRFILISGAFLWSTLTKYGYSRPTRQMIDGWIWWGCCWWLRPQVWRLKRVFCKRWDSQCMLDRYLHPLICWALLVEEVTQVCLCHDPDGFWHIVPWWPQVWRVVLAWLCWTCPNLGDIVGLGRECCWIFAPLLDCQCVLWYKPGDMLCDNVWYNYSRHDYTSTLTTIWAQRIVVFALSWLAETLYKDLKTIYYCSAEFTNKETASQINHLCLMNQVPIFCELTMIPHDKHIINTVWVLFPDSNHGQIWNSTKITWHYPYAVVGTSHTEETLTWINVLVMRKLRWNPQAQNATSDDMMYQKEWQYTPYNVMHMNSQPIIGPGRVMFVSPTVWSILWLSLRRHFGIIKGSLTQLVRFVVCLHFMWFFQKCWKYMLLSS